MTSPRPAMIASAITHGGQPIPWGQYPWHLGEGELGIGGRGGGEGRARVDHFGR